MKKYVIMVPLLLFMLTGCTSPPERVVPVVKEVAISDLLARPPAEAMIPPKEPEKLPSGLSNADAIEVIKKNNIKAAEDRMKLRTLQQYVKTIFSSDK
ncbi:TPA: hypothetical protein N6Y90_004893 [Escherichia coli]|nr:hypothetical protein [Escherichia coli]